MFINKTILLENIKQVCQSSFNLLVFAVCRGPVNTKVQWWSEVMKILWCPTLIYEMSEFKLNVVYSQL